MGNLLESMAAKNYADVAAIYTLMPALFILSLGACAMALFLIYLMIKGE